MGKIQDTPLTREQRTARTGIHPFWMRALREPEAKEQAVLPDKENSSYCIMRLFPVHQSGMSFRSSAQQSMCASCSSRRMSIEWLRLLVPRCVRIYYCCRESRKAEQRVFSNWPRFAIIALSHLSSRCTAVPHWAVFGHGLVYIHTS